MENPIQPIRFNISSKSWFLTYPRCLLDKEVVKQLLEDKGRPIKGGVVARELHEDGTPHIHVYLVLENAYNCKNPSYWDLQEYHGNYQSCKSATAVVKYVKKDKDYLEFGDLDFAAKMAAKEGHRAYVGKRLMTDNLIDVVQDHPELLFGLKKLSQDIDYYKSLQLRPLPTCEGFIPNSLGVLMPIRTDKQRHYWIYSSKPNKGKTTFLLALDKAYRCSWYSLQENFQSIKPDSQFILLDEYSVAHLKVTQLNSMCDGTYQYPTKGGSPVTTPGVILILVGNKKMEECYTNPENHLLLKARFNLICLD